MFDGKTAWFILLYSFKYILISRFIILLPSIAQHGNTSLCFSIFPLYVV